MVGIERILALGQAAACKGELVAISGGMAKEGGWYLVSYVQQLYVLVAETLY
jgi:hypothetical protein